MENPSPEPFLFPRTDIGPQALEALLAVFRQVGILQVGDGELPAHLSAARDAGRLSIRRPAGDAGTGLTQLAADYRRWIEDNRGSEIRVRHLQRGLAPMLDEASAARLRGQILSGSARGAMDGPDDSRRMAQLFLAAAEMWAGETAALRKEMAAHGQAERALFDRLHGDPSELALFPLIAAPSAEEIDPCAERTPQWISAWCRLVLDDVRVPGVWITFSSAVVSWMREVFDGIRRIGAIGEDELHGDGAARRLDELLRAAAEGTGTVLAGIDDFASTDAPPPPSAMLIWQAPGVSPRAAAERLAPGAEAPPAAPEDLRHLVLIQLNEYKFQSVV